MLYETFQAQSDALAPIRLIAAIASGALRCQWQPFRGNPLLRGAGAACELLARAGMSHSRPDFGIKATSLGNAIVPITETAVFRHPFCTLVHFKKEHVVEQPRVLIVAPLSGHFATLLRGTAETLLSDHDVYITDWINARDVPLHHGHFDFDDYIDLLIEFIRFLGPRLHIVAVCQPSVPVLAAAALMAAAGEVDQPASMTLIGGPIDTRLSPTKVNRLATSRSLDWFERNVIATVPARYRGASRRVYPGFVQVAGFMSMNLDRHLSAHLELFQQLVQGDDEGAAATKRFYDEYMSVMDLPADFYLQTVQRVFQDHSLPRGLLVSRGRRIDPATVERTALLTVEGETDDICGAGQTLAAHELCRNLPRRKKVHHLQRGAGHYGVFNGRHWRNEIYPKLRDFIRANP